MNLQNLGMKSKKFHVMYTLNMYNKQNRYISSILYLFLNFFLLKLIDIDKIESRVI